MHWKEMTVPKFLETVGDGTVSCLYHEDIRPRLAIITGRKAFVWGQLRQRLLSAPIEFE